VAVQAVVEKAAVANTGPSPHLDTVFESQTSSHDAKFLSQVARDAEEVLRLAALTDFTENLPYAPTRLRISVVSSSVFLLKAISVGSRSTDTADILLTLEQSARALQQLAPDDMCFASRSAMLIEKQTARLRESLAPNRDKRNTRRSSAETGTQTFNEQNTDYSNDMTDLTDQNVLGGMMDFDGFDSTALISDADAWLTLPYDYNMAPFNTTSDAMSLGFEVDSLDFLWTLGS
jgi:hypothetical protein